MMTRSNLNGKDLALGLLLIALLLFTYLPALSGGLVWDDDAHVTKPALQSFGGLWSIWTELGATQQYYPLLHSAFWLEHVLWGDEVTGYHVANLLLHATAALLLVAVVRQLAVPGAWLAAFLFALHPLNVESAAWISEQKNTLSAVFYLASALVYVKFDQTRVSKKYWIAFGLFLAALLSKSVTATLPAALLIALWWKRGKLDLRRDVAPLVPWFGVGAAMGLFTSWVERSYIGAQGAGFSLSLLERCLLAGRIVWFYLLKLVWPVNLMFVYPHWTIDARAGWQYLFVAGVLALAAALMVTARRNRVPLAGLLFFLATLAPALGFVNVYPFKFSYVADHFQYLAGLGVIVPCAAGLVLLSSRMGDTARKSGMAALVGVLLFVSWGQSATYKDAYTLYSETLARNPEAWMAHNELGLMLGRYPNRGAEAIQHLEAAKHLQPDSAEIRLNLGVILSETPGRLGDAVTELQAALRLRPGYAEAHNNLGSVLSEIPGRKPEAIAEYEAALKANPLYADAHNNLGSALSEEEGRLPEAISHFEEALRLNPNLAEAHANLGAALAKTQGRMPEAVKHFEAALELRPDMRAVREMLRRVKSGGQ